MKKLVHILLGSSSSVKGEIKDSFTIRQLEEDPLLEPLDKIVPLGTDIPPDAQIRSSPTEKKLNFFQYLMTYVMNFLQQEDRAHYVGHGQEIVPQGWPQWPQ